MLSARVRRGAVLGVLLAVLAGALVAVVAPLALAPAPAHAATYGAPSWWKGDCDTDNWTPKARAAGWTGAPAGRLGGQVLGIPVCGPRNLAGGPNVWWSRPGWGELEWQCVEFAQRFMIQVYGTEPYQANGVDVVRNYTTARGGGLVRVDNGTVGKAPQPGDVVSFSSPTNVYGHVAVVASSTVDANGNGSVLLATQNDTVDGWRTLAVSGWKMAAFGSLYPYAWLHDPLGRGGGNGAGPVSPTADGTFVQYAGDIYRMAGGAPVYVSSWTPFGGPKPFTVLTAAQFAALRAVPRDGSFVRDPSTGAISRTVGGAPVHVTSCSLTGLANCAGWVDVDPAAIAQAGTGGRWNHLLPDVPDGALVRRADPAQNGWIGVGVGGSLLHVTDCGPFNGCAGFVDLTSAGVDEYLADHATPRDGTVAVGRPSGDLWAWTGGVCRAVTTSTTTPVPVNDGTTGCLARPSVQTGQAVVLVAGRAAAASLTASGGSGSFVWTLEGGTLPAGVTLASSGRLTGTPTTPGTSTIAVRATDATWPDSGVAAVVTLTVVAPLVLTTTAVPTLTAGRAADVALQTTGGAPALTWSTAGGALPPGLTLSAAGHLVGTPSAVGTWTVTVRVGDAATPAQVASVSLTLDVVPGGTFGRPGS